MTDILTRLAALTQKDDNGLLPCPSCGGELYLRKVGNEHTKQRGYDTGCEKCRIHKSDRIIHQNHEWLLPKVIAAWNNRHRESALIALVQEAAAEIKRLRGLVNVIRMKAEWRFQGSDFVAEEDPAYAKVSEAARAATAYIREILAVADRALNQQEEP